MGPDCVVVFSPCFDDDLRLAKREEELAVEELIPEAGIEAFDISMSAFNAIAYLVSVTRMICRAVWMA